MPVEEEEEEEEPLVDGYYRTISTQATTDINGEFVMGKVSHILFGRLDSKVMCDLEGKELKVSSYTELTEIKEPQTIVKKIDKLLSVQRLKDRLSKLTSNLFSSIVEIEDPGIPVNTRATQDPPLNDYYESIIEPQLDISNLDLDEIGEICSCCNLYKKSLALKPNIDEENTIHDRNGLARDHVNESDYDSKQQRPIYGKIRSNSTIELDNTANKKSLSSSDESLIPQNDNIVDSNIKHGNENVSEISSSAKPHLNGNDNQYLEISEDKQDTYSEATIQKTLDKENIKNNNNIIHENEKISPKINEKIISNDKDNINMKQETNENSANSLPIETVTSDTENKYQRNSKENILKSHDEFPISFDKEKNKADYIEPLNEGENIQDANDINRKTQVTFKEHDLSKNNSKNDTKIKGTDTIVKKISRIKELLLNKNLDICCTKNLQSSLESQEFKSITDTLDKIPTSSPEKSNSLNTVNDKFNRVKELKDDLNNNESAEQRTEIIPRNSNNADEEATFINGSNLKPSALDANNLSENNNESADLNINKLLDAIKPDNNTDISANAQCNNEAAVENISNKLDDTSELMKDQNILQNNMTKLLEDARLKSKNRNALSFNDIKLNIKQSFKKTSSAVSDYIKNVYNKSSDFFKQQSKKIMDKTSLKILKEHSINMKNKLLNKIESKDLKTSEKEVFSMQYTSDLKTDVEDNATIEVDVTSGSGIFKFVNETDNSQKRE